MWHIRARNVNQAMNDALWRFKTGSMSANSRNGKVLRAPGPVVTEYLFPQERLIFSPVRDANHVFHLMETIWMLAGENNVEWLLPFNSNFRQYAEINGEQWGAYGHRWRKHFERDQLMEVVEQLKVPDNRRCVLGMWDPKADLGARKADVPCNTHAYFEVQRGALNMTVCNRSNDVVWGAYGANAVHFSMLQELLALELNLDVGTYYQFSNNFHIYLDMGPGNSMLATAPTSGPYDPYKTGATHHEPLLRVGESLTMFLDDCEKFVTENTGFKTYFMRNIAHPLREAYLARKAGQQWRLNTCVECDWKLSFFQWVNRRNKEKLNGSE